MEQDVAELVGILLGDGCISVYNKNGKIHRRVKISLNAEDEKEYAEYVANLMERVLGKRPRLFFRPNEKTLDLLLFRKADIEYLTGIGMMTSPKAYRAKMPDQLVESALSLYTLRGYFDTDGCIAIVNNNGTVYPRLEMKVCQSPMLEQFVRILKRYGFKFGVYRLDKKMYRIQMNGPAQLKRWAELVGFSNPKNLRRYEMVAGVRFPPGTLSRI